MSRSQQRGVSLVVLFALSGFLVYVGWQGWRVNYIPAQYLGYLIGAFAVVGLCGVNIWHGGPFDRRFDPPPPVSDLGLDSSFPIDESNPYAAPRTSSASAPPSIQIVGIPPGEAPEEIRRCWVGLTLPLAMAGPQSRLGSGVLSGPRSIAATRPKCLTARFRRSL